MYRFVLATYFVVALHGVLCPQTSIAQFRDPLLMSLPNNCTLVHAEVTDVVAKNRDVIGALKITRVYAGDKALLGRTFKCPSHDEPQQGNDPLNIVPRLSKGENGIWLLGARGGKQPVAWSLFPARHGISKRYEEALHLATDIEDVASASEPQRFKRITPYVFDDTPEVAEWAIERLQAAAEGGNEEVAEYLRSLPSNDRVSLSAQIRLDDALTRIDPHTWAASPDREAMLKRLVAAKHTELEGQRLFYWLNVIAQGHARRALPPEKLLPLTATAVANEKIPLTARCRFGAVVYYSVKRQSGVQQAWDLTVGLIRESKDPEIQLAAAQSLAYFPLDEDRRLILNQLLESATEEPIQKAIDRALRQKEMDK